MFAQRRNESPEKSVEEGEFELNRNFVEVRSTILAERASLTIGIHQMQADGNSLLT